MDYLLLGTLEVVREGKPLALPAGKPRAVLALLLLQAGDAVSTDLLAEALWDGRPPETAANAIQGHVARLRRLLGKNAIVTRSPGYLLALADGDTLDLARFEQLFRAGREALAASQAKNAAGLLSEALALFRGTPLSDFRYEPFAQAVVRRLDELRLACLEERIEAELALALHAELVGELEALLTDHPLRERLQGQRMLALYRSGRQAEALDAYQQARSRLVEELGIEPAPALQELERRILRQDPSLELDTTPAEPTEVPQPLAQPLRSIVVTGRDRAQLRGLLPLAELLAVAKEPHELLLTQLLSADGRDTGDALAGATAELDQERRTLAEQGVAARVAVFTSSNRGEDVVRLSTRSEVDLLLLGADETVLVDGRLTEATRRILAEAPSHVGLWVKRDRIEDPQIRAVALPFGGAEHDWAAVEVAAWAASADAVELHLIGTAADSEAGRRDASRLLADAALVVQLASDVVPKPVLAPPGREGLIEASKDADLLVVGLSDRWVDEGLGQLRWALARTAPSPVLFVRRGLRPSGLAPANAGTRYTWSVTELTGR